MRLPSLSLSVPSAAALLILGLPLLAEAMALQRVRMGAIDGQVAIERRSESPSSTSTSSSTADLAAPTSPSGAENNVAIPNRGWKKHAKRDNSVMDSSSDKQPNKRGLLDLLGLGRTTNGGSGSSTTTPAAAPSGGSDDGGVEENPGFRGWAKRGDNDDDDTASDDGTEENYGLARGWVKRQNEPENEGGEEENWALRGFVKLVKRQDGDLADEEEKNIGPYRGY